jgi:hypothetical protein
VIGYGNSKNNLGIRKLYFYMLELIFVNLFEGMCITEETVWSKWQQRLPYTVKLLPYSYHNKNQQFSACGPIYQFSFGD